MDTLFLGLLGSSLLLAAWINEVWRLHKSKNVEAMAIKFLILYFISNALLLIHALNIQDTSFIFMQSALLLITLIEFDIVQRKRAKPRGKRNKVS